MQERTTPRRPELHTTIIATSNELVAVGAAITTYQKWLASTPQSAAENHDIIKLLDRFQRRLTQLPPAAAPQEGLYGQP
jgi:hypothetical protein